jgi:alanine racemase
MSRSTFALLSTERLHHNLKILKQKAPHSELMAMIKANAYGHGIRSVAKRLDGLVDNFGVASIDEAIAIRDVGVKGRIAIVEGVTDPDDLLIASARNIEVVFHDASQLKWLKEYRLPFQLTAWLKIDTGMGRLGFDPEEAHQWYALLEKNPFIRKPIGILSHFACAEEDHALNQKQIALFHSFAERYPEAKKSFCNSAALFSFPEQHHHMVRAGISLYGISPFPGTVASDLGLLPVMTLQTRLIAVRERKKGSTIGYNATYVCPEDMSVGVIAIGYGDGYPRSAPAGTPVLVNNVLCPLVGRVSMDMITIDLRNNPTAQVGDPVLLWGDGLPIEKVAQALSYSAYELVTSIAPRVKFYWTC